MKDFFGRELVEGDTVAILQRAGSSSVYIRAAKVTGFTSQRVKVRFVPQGINSETDSCREPYNVIKK